ncbi:hypothetical protein [Craterilacuibacter sinensis]|uniref:Uncharacterized protein n=1 Tax=Craterilacuibacter sinensis TaxID=2686017 RepID=A0A845BLQ4_9NEIS|nr:hypothetical protein [Craterilacuibacter sinensis]MXR37169.1 hypothetical protein [Craterilacuibacter sinensis]
MAMQYAVQRYAATRPWAKRAGQIFSQTLKMEQASEELAEVARRELDRAAQVFPVPDAARHSEGLLALAYGCFVREGRVIVHFEPALTAALAHTRLPSNLPDTLALPARACFVHVDGLGGACLYHDEADAALDLVLMGDTLGLDSTSWLVEAEVIASLRISYPGELAEQIAAVDEAWQPLLAAVINGLALMTQPRASLVRTWESAAPQEMVVQANDETSHKARQKARSMLLKEGFSEVSYCRVEDLPALDAPQTQGYWRRQAFGEGKAHSRLVWVLPR